MTKTKDNADLKVVDVTFQTTREQNKRWPFFNPTELIPAECEVFYIPKKDNGDPDPDNGYTRVAKYLPGAKSVWKDECSEIDQNKRARKLKLTYGHLVVKIKDRNLLNYLRISGNNSDNEHTTNINSSVLYKEINYEYDAEKVIKDERKAEKARSFVLNAPVEDVRAIALSLAGTQPEMVNISTMDEYTLRNYTRASAVSNPEAFLGNMQEGSSKNKLFIIKALKAGVINVDDKMGWISWASSDEVFVEAAQGTNPIDYFAELSESNDKYKALLSSVKDLINESEDKIEKEKKPVEWTDALIDQAIDKNILTESGGNWLIIPGEEGEEPLLKIQGRKKLRSAIKDNEDNVIALLSGVKV
jgi:hypothetical protein